MRHSSFYQPGGMVYEAVKRQDVQAAAQQTKGEAPASPELRQKYIVEVKDGRRSGGFDSMTAATLAGIASDIPFDQWDVIMEWQEA